MNERKQTVAVSCIVSYKENNGELVSDNMSIR